MRVLAVTPNYPPNSRVGAWLATHRYMRHLVTRGHHVTAVAANVAGRGWEVDGIPVLTGQMGRSSLVRLSSEFDVVVAHFGDGGHGKAVATKAGRPVALFAHGYIGRGPSWAELIVFNSEAMRARVAWDGPAIVCRPYTDPAEYRTTPGDRVTLVNLTEEKGGRIFNRLARGMPDTKFLAVRGGYGAQVVPNHPNVDVIGTTKNMRDDVYARTRVLLMPSQMETWGMVGVEAMASGIPVVATPTPGPLEALGVAGIFVERADIHGWIRELERLADPVEWCKASELALLRSAQLAELDGRDVFADALEAIAA